MARLIVGSAVFLMVFLIVAPLIGAVTGDDIINLRKMFSGLGIVSRFVNLFLVFLENKESPATLVLDDFNSKVEDGRHQITKVAFGCVGVHLTV